MRLVVNRTVTLRDTWANLQKAMKDSRQQEQAVTALIRPYKPE